ncbi:YopX family protein [Weissella tructae]
MTKRDIKFRRWDDEFKRFITWDMMINPNEINAPILALDKLPHEQYTGTDDKNGVAIYENDILRQDILGRGYYYYVVEWYRGCFFLSRVGGSSRKAMFLEYEEDYITEFEVIGNIHANPELLEV